MCKYNHRPTSATQEKSISKTKKVAVRDEPGTRDLPSPSSLPARGPPRTPPSEEQFGDVVQAIRSQPVLPAVQPPGERPPLPRMSWAVILDLTRGAAVGLSTATPDPDTALAARFGSPGRSLGSPPPLDPSGITILGEAASRSSTRERGPSKRPLRDPETAGCGPPAIVGDAWTARNPRRCSTDGRRAKDHLLTVSGLLPDARAPAARLLSATGMASAPIPGKSRAWKAPKAITRAARERMVTWRETSGGFCGCTSNVGVSRTSELKMNGETATIIYPRLSTLAPEAMCTNAYTLSAGTI